MQVRSGFLVVLVALGGCALKSDVARLERQVATLEARTARQDSARAAQLNEVINLQQDILDSLAAGRRALVALQGDDSKVGDAPTIDVLRQDIVILESMKMECSIKAPSDGRIEKLLVAVDDSVEEGDELVIIAAIDPDLEHV